MFKIKCNLPCGKEIYVNEINNEMYIALHKFVLNEDYLGFYNLLDTLIINDEQIELSLLDKFYIYLTIYIYCIKSYIELEATSVESYMMRGQEKIDLSEALERIGKVSNNSMFLEMDSKIGKIKIEYTLPKNFEIINEKLVFNPISGIKKIYKDDICYKISTEKDYKSIENLIFSTENYYKLIKEIYNNFDRKIIIVPEKIELSILNYATYIYFAKNFFCGNLKYIYDCIFLCSTELHIQPSEFKKMSPIESEMLIVEYIKKRKEEEKRQREKNNSQNEFEL